MQKILLFTMLLGQGASEGFNMQERIVGGENSKGSEWPWQVTLQKSGEHMCGGTLVSESWVLLTAHCIETPLELSTYNVYLGVLNLSDLSNSNIVKRNVTQVIVHPDFTEEGSRGDIALIRLDKAVSFTSFISPVRLLSQSVHLPEGKSCLATGWGEIKERVKLPVPKTLQMVEVALLENAKCEEMYQMSLGYGPPYHLIEDDMICAGYKDGKKDACQGDSGGPLLCNVKGTWLQVGIISWGYGCARRSSPGVYTRLQYYQSWIQQNVPSIRYSEGGETSPWNDFISNNEPIKSAPQGMIAVRKENATFNGTEMRLGSGADSCRACFMIIAMLMIFPLMTLA